jgi:uncharacterized short protein YbdD (DUF466 family)
MAELAARLRSWATRATAVTRRIIGVPDYDRYVEHMRVRHPDRALLSREEFVRTCMESRYNQPGSRCC